MFTEIGRRLLAHYLFAALLMVYATSVFAIEDCQLNGKSVSFYDGTTTADKTGVIRCKDSSTGLMIIEREIHAGGFTDNITNT